VLLSRWVPVLGPGGEVREWMGASTDVTEGKRAEQRQKLLLAELQRRVKNILSVVRSVTQRTIQTSSSLAAFSEHFDGRIAALARAQTIAIRTPDSGVDLAELISEEVLCGGARDGEQVTLDGPTIRLTHKAAETLALAFHELATNAVKFGALAVSGGRVAVRWRIVGEEGARRLGLTWRETVTGISEPDPTRRGFGRELIERQLPYELEAETAFDLVPDGILCTINLPLSDKVVVQDGAPAPSRGEA
jgi:two-component system CheB/CheR fusion protein